MYLQAIKWRFHWPTGELRCKWSGADITLLFNIIICIVYVTAMVMRDSVKNVSLDFDELTRCQYPEYKNVDF
jgi:hypothetical protein